MHTHHRIKKYGNRRLYDTLTRRYLTQEGLAELIRSGDTVEVVDAKTDEDLTRLVLLQLLLESHKNGLPFLFSSELLHRLIQTQDPTMIDFFQGYLPRMLGAYTDWQQQAQSQFLNWANMGWAANPAAREMMNPAMSSWRGEAPNGHGETEAVHPEKAADPAAEIQALRAQLANLEKRLKPTRKRR